MLKSWMDFVGHIPIAIRFILALAGGMWLWSALSSAGKKPPSNPPWRQLSAFYALRKIEPATHCWPSLASDAFRGVVMGRSTVVLVEWPFDELAGHYQLAYDAATESIRDQRDRIDEIRARAVTLLSVAAAVTAFLGDRIFAPGAFDRLETGWAIFNGRLALVIAVLAFLWIASAAVWAWRPIGGNFTLNAQFIIDIHIEEPWPSLSRGELLRELALSTNDNVDENRSTLRRRQRALSIAMGALGLELVMMVLVLWDLVK